MFRDEGLGGDSDHEATLGWSGDQLLEGVKELLGSYEASVNQKSYIVGEEGVNQ